MFCSNCGKEIDDKAVICPGCGYAVKGKAEKSADKGEIAQGEKKRFCSNCGKEIDNKAVICPGCGCKVKKAKKNLSAGETVQVIWEIIFFMIFTKITGFIYPLISFPIINIGITLIRQKNKQVGTGITLVVLGIINLIVAAVSTIMILGLLT